MGWTYQHATKYKNGKIDRKTECDNVILQNNTLKIEKSTIIGSTYYAAVTQVKKYDSVTKTYCDIQPHNQTTFAVIFLTSVNNKDYYNFGYKDMTEEEGPCERNCPRSILNLLSSTDNKTAIEWRQDCYTNTEMKSLDRLRNLPIGTMIEISDGNKFIKCEAGHQFKKPSRNSWLNRIR